jgi:TRAP-type C4-dicarboxylate transport system permease small subunit
MQTLDKISQFLNRVLVLFGGVFLVGMILLTCGNIISRAVWIPIRGTFELMGFFGAVVTAFALGYTQIKKGHIAVDVLVSTFSKPTKKLVQTINLAAGTFFFAIAAWQITVKATTLMRTGEITETLRIIYYPFTYAVALGCLFLALVLLIDLIKLFAVSKEDRS